MHNGRYIKFRVGRKIITMWDGQKTIAFKDSHNETFIANMLKAFSQTKKEIKAKQKAILDYLGITDRKLLNKCVKYHFDKFVESKDKTEIAEKSGKDIF